MAMHFLPVQGERAIRVFQVRPLAEIMRGAKADIIKFRPSIARRLSGISLEAAVNRDLFPNLTEGKQLYPIGLSTLMMFGIDDTGVNVAKLVKRISQENPGFEFRKTDNTPEEKAAAILGRIGDLSCLKLDSKDSLGEILNQFDCDEHLRKAEFVLAVMQTEAAELPDWFAKGEFFGRAVKDQSSGDVYARELITEEAFGKLFKSETEYSEKILEFLAGAIKGLGTEEPAEIVWYLKHSLHPEPEAMGLILATIGQRLFRKKPEKTMELIRAAIEYDAIDNDPKNIGRFIASACEAILPEKQAGSLHVERAELADQILKGPSKKSKDVYQLMATLAQALYENDADCRDDFVFALGRTFFSNKNLALAFSRRVFEEIATQIIGED